MVQLSSKDSSRNLHVDCAVSFRFYPHLIFHACVQTFYFMWLFGQKFAENFTFCRNLSWTPGAKSCSLADGYRRIFSLKLWSSSVMVLLPSTRVCTSSSQHKNQTHYCHSWFLFCRNCSRVQHINERYHYHPLVLLIWQEFLNNRCGSNIVGNNNFVQNNSSRK